MSHDPPLAPSERSAIVAAVMARPAVVALPIGHRVVASPDSYARSVLRSHQRRRDQAEALKTLRRIELNRDVE